MVKKYCKDDWQHGCETASPLLYGVLKAYASENRKNQTVAERILWKEISRNRYHIKFRRQHIIGCFIVDFVCLSCRLVIEVDGAYHAELAQQESDENRTKDLNNLGYAVVRFTNEQVINNCAAVAERIYDKVIALLNNG